MVVRVSRAEHGAQGKPKNPWCCPLAVALNQQLGGRWYVGAHIAYDETGGHRYMVLLPSQVVDVLRVYDNTGYLPEEFNFEVDDAIRR